MFKEGHNREFSVGTVLWDGFVLLCSYTQMCFLLQDMAAGVALNLGTEPGPGLCLLTQSTWRSVVLWKTYPEYIKS